MSTREEESSRKSTSFQRPACWQESVMTSRSRMPKNAKTSCLQTLRKNSRESRHSLTLFWIMKNAKLSWLNGKWLSIQTLLKLRVLNSIQVKSWLETSRQLSLANKLTLIEQLHLCLVVQSLTNGVFSSQRSSRKKQILWWKKFKTVSKISNILVNHQNK